jgi:hypothetical protein
MLPITVSDATSLNVVFDIHAVHIIGDLHDVLLDNLGDAAQAAVSLPSLIT